MTLLGSRMTSVPPCVVYVVQELNAGAQGLMHIRQVLCPLSYSPGPELTPYVDQAGLKLTPPLPSSVLD